MSLNNKEELIQVAELLSKYDAAHHRETASAYFSKVDVHHPISRKPFHSAIDCGVLLPGIAAVVDAIRPAAGDRVLDLGCGTGWLTRILSDLGCEAYGVDIAPTAISLSEQLSQKALTQGQAHFCEYNGTSLPFADGYFDAVIAFDSFHHIANQAQVLQEMFRVLNGGGRVAFHEPGPNHSRLPESQMEMRAFGVLEQDMVIEQFALLAQRIGFSAPMMCYTMMQSLWVDVPRFNKLLADPTPKPLADEVQMSQEVRAHTSRQFENLRIFYLEKPGAGRVDSRRPIGLAGQIELESVRHNGNTHKIKVRIKNTGTATWLPSGKSVGAVNLGVQLVSADNQMLDRDFERISLLHDRLLPSASVTREFDVTTPPGTQMRLDLVAEWVAWFERLGGVPVRIS